MNKILLMALVLGTLSTTTALAATDMTTTVSSKNSIPATIEAKTYQTEAYGIQSVTAVPKIYGDGEKNSGYYHQISRSNPRKRTNTQYFHSRRQNNQQYLY